MNKSEKFILWILILAVTASTVVSIVGLVGGNNQSVLGGGSRFPNGLSTDSTLPSAGQVRTATLTTTGAATLGGNLTVTTSNTATSTATVGCIQTYATSTLTPVRIVLSSTGTTTATFGAGTANGGVSWQYGSCPI